MKRSPSRVCPTCGASDWGTRNRCNPCRARAQREAWAANPTDARAKDSARHRAWRAANRPKVRAQDLRRLYGLDLVSFEALLAAQGRRCAICRAEEPRCVDHCHRSGTVRGILCRPCNSALGQFRDDPELVLAAIAYLREVRR